MGQKSKSAPPARQQLGFRDGEKGVHSSRTLMLSELSQVLAATPPDAGIADFRRVVVEDNVLGKRTATTREHTVRKLKALFGLDPSVPVYRLMRNLWEQETDGRPLLALLCAVARDPLIRESVDAILDLPDGAVVTSADMIETVSSRFSATTRKAIGANLASSWTQAGFLSGIMTKIRTRANATPGATTYALALGFMEGCRGSLLLTTLWTRLLDCPPAEVLDLVRQAALRGWVEYRAAGDVMDIRVEALFTEEERGWCSGQPG